MNTGCEYAETCATGQIANYTYHDTGDGDEVRCAFVTEVCLELQKMGPSHKPDAPRERVFAESANGWRGAAFRVRCVSQWSQPGSDVHRNRRWHSLTATDPFQIDLGPSSWWRSDL